MADITPGITHAVKDYDESVCGIECTSDWDDDDDAEFIYSNDISEVDCKNCLKFLNEEITMDKQGKVCDCKIKFLRHIGFYTCIHCGKIDVELSKRLFKAEKP